jgi:hypothetical protein
MTPLIQSPYEDCHAALAMTPLIQSPYEDCHVIMLLAMTLFTFDIFTKRVT